MWYIQYRRAIRPHLPLEHQHCCSTCWLEVYAASQAQSDWLKGKAFQAKGAQQYSHKAETHITSTNILLQYISIYSRLLQIAGHILNSCDIQIHTHTHIHISYWCVPWCTISIWALYSDEGLHHVLIASVHPMTVTNWTSERNTMTSLIPIWSTCQLLYRRHKHPWNCPTSQSD